MPLQDLDAVLNASSQKQTGRLKTLQEIGSIQSTSQGGEFQKRENVLNSSLSTGVSQQKSLTKREQLRAGASPEDVVESTEMSKRDTIREEKVPNVRLEGAKEFAKESFERSKEIGMRGGSKIWDAVLGTTIEGEELGALERLQRGAEGVVGTIAGASGMVLSPAAGIVGLAKPELEENLPTVIENVKTAYSKLPTEAQDKIKATYEFAKDNPVVLEGLEAIANLVGGGVASKTGTLATKGATEGVIKAAQTAAPIIEKAAIKTGTAISEGGEALLNLTKSTLGKAKTAIDEAQIAKASKGIEKSVNTFLGSKKSLVNKVNELKSRNVDISKYMKDPEIFGGLKLTGGKLDPTEAIDIIDERIAKALAAKQEILPIVDNLVRPVTKEQLRSKALSLMDELSPADQQGLIQRINAQIDALPDEIKISDLDDLRAKFRNSSRDAKGQLKSASEYSALESAARDLVFEATDNLPIDTNKAFTNLNVYVKDMIATKEFLDKTARATIVDSDKLTKLFNKTYGAIAGSSLGPVGSVAGAEVAGVISNILANNQLGNTIKRKMILKLIGEGPEQLKMVDDLLMKVKEYQVPRLTAPKEGAPRSKIESGPTIPLKRPGAEKGLTEQAPSMIDNIKEGNKRIEDAIKQSDKDLGITK